MPRTLHYKPPADGGVFLATPAYAGLSASYVYALFASTRALQEAGIDAHLEIMAENCHVDDSRNVLVRDFLETDCESLVFLDADLRWNPSELVRLIQHDVDIVAGIYPLKNNPKEDMTYPIRHLPGDTLENEIGLLEVEAVPTGFLKISRQVLESLAEDAPGFRNKLDTSDRIKTPLIFERTMLDGARWGGDYTFCMKAREKGFKVWIDPHMTFEHAGEHVWNGCYADHLVKQANQIHPKIIKNLADISCDRQTDDTFIDLFRTWNNEWASSPELLAACFEIARQYKTPVLEFGSGLSSLVMAAAGANVYALEHDWVWYEKITRIKNALSLDNLTVKYAPIRDYGDFRWYDIDQLPDTREYGIMLVDGPPRDVGRKGFDVLVHSDHAVVIRDDTLMTAECKGQFSFGVARPFFIKMPEAA